MDHVCKRFGEMSDAAMMPFNAMANSMNFSGPGMDDAHRAAPTGTDHLSGIQKAAIIVRVLVAEGVDLQLSALSARMQENLTRTMGEMRLIDRTTMNAVVAEYVDMLEQVGLSFPDGLDGALSLLDGRLDAMATQQLRMLARGANGRDPWADLEAAPDTDLLPVLEAESTVVGAVVLSKLSIDKAAGLLSQMAPDLAQALAISVAKTEDIDPDTVARIGVALAQQVTDKPLRAFAKPSTKRVGEILNSSPTALRDRLLAGLDNLDQGFATGVRKSIFTFQDIPARITPRDVPTLMREVPSDDMMFIIAANTPEDQPTLEFLLSNMSKRIADTMREDATALPVPTAKQKDEIMARVMGSVRGMIDAGTITLQSLEEEDV